MSDIATSPQTSRPWRQRGQERAVRMLGSADLWERYDGMELAAAVSTVGVAGKSAGATQTFSVNDGGTLTFNTSAGAGEYSFQGFSGTNVTSWLTTSWYARARFKKTSANGVNCSLGLQAIVVGGTNQVLTVGMAGATRQGSATAFSATLADVANVPIRGAAFSAVLDTAYHTVEAWFKAGDSQIYVTLDEADLKGISIAGVSTVANVFFAVGALNNADAAAYAGVAQDLQVLGKVT